MGSNPFIRTKEKHLKTYVSRCFSFCCTAAFTAPPYRYAPFASRYSIRHSSTLPPCFQAAKPLPGLPAVRPWLYCRCPPHQGADQGLCSGSAGRRWPCAACRPRRSRCVHGRWSRRAVSAAAGSVSTSLQTSRRAGSYAYIRRTSDRLCKEHGLSVVTSQLYRCRKVERPRT